MDMSDLMECLPPEDQERLLNLHTINAAGIKSPNSGDMPAPVHGGGSSPAVAKSSAAVGAAPAGGAARTEGGRTKKRSGFAAKALGALGFGSGSGGGGSSGSSGNGAGGAGGGSGVSGAGASPAAMAILRKTSAGSTLSPKSAASLAEATTDPFAAGAPGTPDSPGLSPDFFKRHGGFKWEQQRGDPELGRVVRRGLLPPEFRAEAWLELSDAKRLMLEHGPGFYAALADKATASAAALAKVDEARRGAQRAERVRRGSLKDGGNAAAEIARRSSRGGDGAGGAGAGGAGTDGSSPELGRLTLAQTLTLSQRAGEARFEKGFDAATKARARRMQSTVRQIDKDVRRTAIHLLGSFAGSGDGRTALRRVLICCAWHVPDVGYCQSMNVLAAFLLLHLEEEEAFWVLAAMVGPHPPGGGRGAGAREGLLSARGRAYYRPDLAGVRIDQCVFEYMAVERLPELVARLKELGVSIPLISIKWFMCLYVNLLPVAVARQVWDNFFWFGPRVLFEVGLELLRRTAPGLLAGAADATEVVELITASAAACDASLLGAAAAEGKGVTEAYVAQLRSVCAAQIALEEEQNELEERDFLQRKAARRRRLAEEAEAKAAAVAAAAAEAKARKAAEAKARKDAQAARKAARKAAKQKAKAQSPRRPRRSTALMMRGDDSDSGDDWLGEASSDDEGDEDEDDEETTVASEDEEEEEDDDDGNEEGGTDAGEGEPKQPHKPASPEKGAGAPDGGGAPPSSASASATATADAEAAADADAGIGGDEFEQLLLLQPLHVFLRAHRYAQRHPRDAGFVSFLNEFNSVLHRVDALAQQLYESRQVETELRKQLEAALGEKADALDTARTNKELLNELLMSQQQVQRDLLPGASAAAAAASAAAATSSTATAATAAKTDRSERKSYYSSVRKLFRKKFAAAKVPVPMARGPVPAPAPAPEVPAESPAKQATDGTGAADAADASGPTKATDGGGQQEQGR